jgi:hypothetical protein
MKKVIFVSRGEAQELSPPPGSAIVSIISSAEGPAMLQEGWQSVLRIKFDDVDSPCQDLVAFSPLHGLDLFEYLRQLSANDNINGLVVHCTMGISRSAAVALFASELLGWPCYKGSREVTTLTWPHYNRHVYRMLKSVESGETRESTQAAYEKLFS